MVRVFIVLWGLFSIDRDVMGYAFSPGCKRSARRPRSSVSVAPSGRHVASETTL